MTFVLYVFPENKMKTVWTAGRQTEIYVIYADYESDDKLSLKKIHSSWSYPVIKFEFLESLVIAISVENIEKDGFLVLFYGIPQLHLVPRLRKSGAMPTLHLYAFRAWTGKTLLFLHFTVTYRSHCAVSLFRYFHSVTTFHLGNEPYISWIVSVYCLSYEHSDSVLCRECCSKLSITATKLWLTFMGPCIVNVFF
jgi:hypothetical protein